MKKINTINLGGRVISMEDKASQLYTAYIGTLNQYFINEEGWLEIMNDIENRAAELMQQTTSQSNACINKSDVENIIRVMGTAGEFKELDNDDWDMYTTSPEYNNTCSDIHPVKSTYALTENTFVQLEGFTRCSS